MRTTERLLEYQNDPTDDYLEVREYSAEEIFYAIENPYKEDYEAYYTSLERKLKSKNDALKVVLGTMKQIDPELEVYIRDINRIINL